MPNTMSEKDLQRGGALDPWDVALLGGAAASMYKSAPVQPAQLSTDVTSLFRSNAGIPKDITPTAVSTLPKPPQALPPTPSMPQVPLKVQIEEKPLPVKIVSAPTPVPASVPSPLSRDAVLAGVPKKQKAPVLPPPALPPAYPMRSVALHFVILFLGIPLFVGGFYLADYTKNTLGEPSRAQVTQGTEGRSKTASATSTLTR